MVTPLAALLALVTAPPAVAVFDIRDLKSGQDAATVEQLNTYLAAQLAQGGVFVVVPRGQLKKALSAEKAESYKGCYDEACQIEIGHEVAAEKTVASQLARVGGKCVLTATLYDLRSGASQTAASASAACKPEALLGAVDAVATQLRGRADTPVDVGVASIPAGTSLQVGLTEVGAAPWRAKLWPGEYELAAHGQDGAVRAAARVKVARENLMVALSPVRVSTIAPARRPQVFPEWVSKATGVVGKDQIAAVGSASLIASPPLRRIAAELRAFAELAKARGSTVRAGAVADLPDQGSADFGVDFPREGSATVMTSSGDVVGAEVVERWTHPGDGTVYVQARAKFVPGKMAFVPIKGRATSHRGLGGADVTAGPPGEWERGARLAAIAMALHRLAADRRGARVTSFMRDVSDDRGSGPVQAVGEALRGTVDATFTKGRAKLVVKSTATSVMGSRFGPQEPGVEAQSVTFELTVDLPEGARLEVKDGLLTRADAVDEARVTAALAQVGLRLVEVHMQPPAAGAPLAEAVIEAPPAL